MKNLENGIQEGSHADNNLEVNGTLGSLTMGGENTLNTLNHMGTSTDLLLQYGSNLQNTIMHFGGEKPSNINQFVSGTTESSNQSVFQNMAEGLLEGSGNHHRLTTWGHLGKIALKGENNQFNLNSYEGIGQLGTTGLNQTATITNMGNTTKPSEAYLNGEASVWRYQGDGQQQLFVGGKNNKVTLVTSSATEKAGLNQNDDIVLAGTGNQIVADSGAGDDTVQVKLAKGFKADLDGGAGNNTLYFEAGNWQTKRLDDGVTVYTRKEGAGANGAVVQTIRARHFESAQFMPPPLTTPLLQD
jgi:hypothetical protein